MAKSSQYNYTTVQKKPIELFLSVQETHLESWSKGVYVQGTLLTKGADVIVPDRALR